MSVTSRFTNSVQVRDVQVWESLCCLATSKHGTWDAQQGVGVVTFISKQAAEEARREIDQ